MSVSARAPSRDTAVPRQRRRGGTQRSRKALVEGNDLGGRNAQGISNALESRNALWEGSDLGGRNAHGVSNIIGTLAEKEAILMV